MVTRAPDRPYGQPGGQQLGACAFLRPCAPTPTLKPRTIEVHKRRLNQLKQWLMENAGSFPGIIDADMGMGTHINYDALQRDPTVFMRYLLSTCKTTRGGRPDVKVNRITANVFALRWAVRTQCDDCCFNAQFWLSSAKLQERRAPEAHDAQLHSR